MPDETIETINLNINLNVNLPAHPQVLDLLNKILTRLETDKELFMSQFSDIVADVAQQTTVDQSLMTLVTNALNQVVALGGNQAAVDSVVATMAANIANVSAFVATNTPAAPVVPGAPAVVTAAGQQQAIAAAKP
jgi:hypothetical protein